MLIDARIPLTIMIAAAAGLVEPDASTVLIACMEGPAPSSLPVEGWALVIILPPDPDTGPAGRMASAHAAGCGCCIARPPLAVALSDLFQQRARGTLPLFRRVLLVISAPAEGAVCRMATSDRLVSGWFRLEHPKSMN